VRPSIFTNADAELLELVTPENLEADPNACFEATARRMGMALREVSDVDVVDAGVFVEMFDGSQYIIVPPDRPDGEGKCGLMFARHPGGAATQFPVYTSHDVAEQRGIASVAALATVKAVDSRKRALAIEIEDLAVRLDRSTASNKAALVAERRELEAEMAALDARREELLEQRRHLGIVRDSSGDAEAGIRKLKSVVAPGA
jgi:hypothetical protein